MIVDVEIRPKPVEDAPDVVFVEDVEALVESAKCSCAAGDDQPY
ncbi:hypothetical protein Acsp03_71350 [Actinomadura sp. NBRC 104412]|nr:hypothetical protein [Actinomadura sp. NBRC 104412]GLZ09669.1 hypothetical protein Acsp03_71350 [Actinomadura sp. NBRC 104412]